MHPLRHAIWGPIWKHTIAIVWINATSVTLRLPTYIIWGHIWKVTVGNVEQIGKNFKSFRKWRPQKHKKLFQQILVDMSNILGKHVYSVKIRRNLIRGIVFVQKLRQLQTFLKFLPKCNLCDNASSQATHLRRHLKTHSGKTTTKMWPVWFCIRWGRPIEETFENTQWKKSD